MRYILSILIFYPLLFLRPLFMMLSTWIIIGCVFGGMMFLGFWLWGNQNTQLPIEMLWVSLTAPFVIFLLRHFYDRLLLTLNPTGHTLLLSQ